MTDDQVWREVNAWLRGLLGGTIPVIKAWESGKMPARPYVTSNFLGTVEVRAHEMDREYEDQGPTGEIFTPVIETEWRFSLNAYAEAPTDVLRPIRAATKINEVNRITALRLHVSSISIIRLLPEIQNEDWKPRAQMDMNVRGLVRDGILIDTVEEFEPFIWTRT